MSKIRSEKEIASSFIYPSRENSTTKVTSLVPTPAKVIGTKVIKVEITKRATTSTKGIDKDIDLVRT
ncbi:MAG: hypothetical protein SV062_00880 [Thermodesulfobacteriota bacterium]|nr:hypothetical protein [Thermodesulfobacteriota bacterium]